MGFSPQQIDAMSMFQYFASLDGFIAAHSTDEDNKLTQDEIDGLWEWIAGS